MWRLAPFIGIIPLPICACVCDWLIDCVLEGGGEKGERVRRVASFFPFHRMQIMLNNPHFMMRIGSRRGVSIWKFSACLPGLEMSFSVLTIRVMHQSRNAISCFHETCMGHYGLLLVEGMIAYTVGSWVSIGWR